MEDKKFKITLINHSLSEPFVGEKFITFRYLIKEKGTSVIFKVPKDGGKWLKENISTFLEGDKEIYVRGYVKKYNTQGVLTFSFLSRTLQNQRKPHINSLLGSMLNIPMIFLLNKQE